MTSIDRGEPTRATYIVDEVAHLLDLSRGNAYRLVREGVIPEKRVGRQWVLPRKTFHDWLEACELPEAV